MNEKNLDLRKLVIKVKQQQSFINDLASVLNKYPTEKDLMQELLINHKRSTKRNEQLARIYLNSMKNKTQQKYIDEINQIVWQQFISQIKQAFPHDDGQHTQLRAFYDPTVIEPLHGITILNDWRTSVILGNLRIKMRLYVNIPVLTNKKNANFMILGHSNYGIAIPINWGTGFYEFKNLNANVTVEILSAYDKRKQYVYSEGLALEAREAYETAKTNYQDLIWYKKLFKPAPEEYDIWLKKQRKCFDPANDQESYSALKGNKKQQAELRQNITQIVAKVEKQTNYTFHNILNYPEFEFGKYHLKFLEPKEY